jgi:phage FluMu protein Com
VRDGCVWCGKLTVNVRFRDGKMTTACPHCYELRIFDDACKIYEFVEEPPRRKEQNG